MTITRQHTTRAALWSAIEIASRYGVQIIVMIVLARLLTPEDFGLIAMLLVFTAVGALLVDSGFGLAIVQRQNTTDDDETTVFLFTIAIGLLVAIILWFAAPAIADFYSQPKLIPLIRLLLFVPPLGGLAAVPDALLTQRLDFRSRTKATVISSLCSGVVAVVLAWKGYGVWSLAWQAVVAIGLRALLLWLFSGWRPRGKFSVASFRSLFGFGSFMLMANLLNTISIRMQSLLIGKMFDSRALGYYTLAQNTQEAPALFIGGVLNRVGLPMFSAVADQPVKLVATLRLSLRVAIFLFVPCMVGIAVVAKPLIVMLYGARWSPAAPLLSILAISAALWPLHVLNLAAIGAQGRSDLIFRLEMVKQVFGIILIAIASPAGPMAIALAVLASSLFGIGVNTWYSKKLLGYGMLAQLRDQIGTLSLSALAALAGWLILHWMAPGTTAMILAISGAAFVYLGIAWFAKMTALAETLSLLRTLWSRELPPPTQST